MTARHESKPGEAGKTAAVKESREDRLRAALRANLQRRKAQERARRQAADKDERG
ncbi:MAG: hypothetical protein ACE5FS_05805 [Paracoccaceae bacterium]